MNAQKTALSLFSQTLPLGFIKTKQNLYKNTDQVWSMNAQKTALSLFSQTLHSQHAGLLYAVTFL